MRVELLFFGLPYSKISNKIYCIGRNTLPYSAWGDMNKVNTLT